MWHRSLTYLAILSLTILCISIGAQERTLPLQVPKTDFSGQPTYTVYKVVRDPDGDTIFLGLGCFITRVRLIGVGTPEAKHTEKPVEPYGAEATMFLTNLLLGEEVYVEQEPGITRDKHNRALVYLYRAPDGLFVNLEIIRQGYGRVDAPSAFQHIGLFTYYEQRAREIGKGMWPAEKNEKGEKITPFHGKSLLPKLYERHELPQLYRIHNPQELGAETKPSCRANQLVLKTKLEKYKQEHGFYPKEPLGYISEISLWPYHPALTYCPEGTPPDAPYEYRFEYRADSVPGSVVIKNEHGTGYSKYELRCTNPACPEYQE